MIGTASVTAVELPVTVAPILVISYRQSASSLRTINIGQANCALSSFPRASVEAIFCDGVVERIVRPDLPDFLADCAAVLANAGLIRIATVDLDRIIHGYLFDWGAGKAAGISRTERVNNAFRDPGIHFLYSEEELRIALAKAGFKEVRRFGLGGSSYPPFWNLPIDSSQGLILEAKKP
jgi:hypothetical protein